MPRCRVLRRGRAHRIPRALGVNLSDLTPAGFHRKEHLRLAEHQVTRRFCPLFRRRLRQRHRQQLHPRQVPTGPWVARRRFCPSHHPSFPRRPCHRLDHHLSDAFSPIWRVGPLPSI